MKKTLAIALSLLLMLTSCALADPISEWIDVFFGEHAELSTSVYRDAIESNTELAMPVIAYFSTADGAFCEYYMLLGGVMNWADATDIDEETGESYDHDVLCSALFSCIDDDMRAIGAQWMGVFVDVEGDYSFAYASGMDGLDGEEDMYTDLDAFAEAIYTRGM